MDVDVLLGQRLEHLERHARVRAHAHATMDTLDKFPPCGCGQAGKNRVQCLTSRSRARLLSPCSP